MKNKITRLCCSSTDNTRHASGCRRKILHPFYLTEDAMRTIADALDAQASGQTIEDARDTYDLANLFRAELPDSEQENMSTESNPDPYQIEHTVIGRKMLGR
jgi:hypothetical protein